MPEISRPVPHGVNKRGRPSYDGLELALYRRALGVPQTAIATRLAMHHEAISILYENKRAPVSLTGDKVERYLDAVERAAKTQAEAALLAHAELIALREAKGYR